jgi:hypothetical protein
MKMSSSWINLHDWCKNAVIDKRIPHDTKSNLEGKTIEKVERMGLYGDTMCCACTDGTRVFINTGEFPHLFKSDVLDSEIFTDEEKNEYIRLVEKEEKEEAKRECESEKKEYERLKAKFGE